MSRAAASRASRSAAASSIEQLEQSPQDASELASALGHRRRRASFARGHSLGAVGRRALGSRARDASCSSSPARRRTVRAISNARACVSRPKGGRSRSRAAQPHGDAARRRSRARRARLARRVRDVRVRSGAERHGARSRWRGRAERHEEAARSRDGRGHELAAHRQRRRHRSRRRDARAARAARRARRVGDDARHRARRRRPLGATRRGRRGSTSTRASSSPATAPACASRAAGISRSPSFSGPSTPCAPCRGSARRRSRGSKRRRSRSATREADAAFKVTAGGGDALAREPEQPAPATRARRLASRGRPRPLAAVADPLDVEDAGARRGRMERAHAVVAQASPHAGDRRCTAVDVLSNVRPSRRGASVREGGAARDGHAPARPRDGGGQRRSEAADGPARLRSHSA